MSLVYCGGNGGGSGGNCGGIHGGGVQWIGGGKGGAILRAHKKQIFDRIHKFRRDEEAFLVALKSESVFGQQLSSWS